MSTATTEAAPVNAPREFLLPRFDEARESLQALPRSTAAEAMTVAGKLASGDAHTWKSVEKARPDRDVLIARVRVHYRMLFRIRDGVLECLMVVHRRILDVALDQIDS